jgi:predicted nucleotidyltransferase
MSVKVLSLPEATVARIHEIARRHGIVDVRLFGSHVRGEAKPGSDLDLLIRLENGRGFRDFMDFCEELERALNLKVDVVPEDGLSRFIRERVLAEAVPL